MKNKFVTSPYFFVFLLVSVFLLSNSEVNSQTVPGRLNRYTVQTFQSTFVSIVGQPGSVCLGSGDDNTYTIPLSTQSPAFSWNFDSAVYNTSIWPATNGYVGVAAAPYCCAYSNPVGFPTYSTTTTSTANWLCPFAADMYVNSCLYYQFSGVAPNRVLTIEWAALRGYSGNGLTTNIQTKIYETTNVIEFWYQEWSKSLGNYQASGVGLNGKTSPSFMTIVSVPSNVSTPGVNFRYTPPLPPSAVELSTSPKILTFGTVAAGTNSPQQFISLTNISNPGSPNLNILSVTIQGVPDFTITSAPASTIIPPQTTVKYGITFNPTQGGTRSAVVNILTDGLDSGLQAIILTGTGVFSEYTLDSTLMFAKTRTRLGDTLVKYLHITSTGQGPFVISSLAITGIDAGQYKIIRFPGPLPAGMSDSIGIAYMPTIEGKRGATLTIVSNSYAHPSVPVNLQGTGVLPHIVLTPSTFMLFDSTAEGDTLCKNLTIYNSGTDTLRLSANFLSSNDGDFTYPRLIGPDTAIAPDQTKTLSVCFHPLQQGTRQGRILLRTNIPLTFEDRRRDTGSTYTIELRGNGLPLGVFSSAFSGLPILDSIAVGKTICRADTIKNIGDADILVTNVSFVDPEFKMGTRQLPPTPFLLKARTSLIIDLCGTPSQQGIRNGMLTLTGSSNTRSKVLDVPLRVYGINVCASENPVALFSIAKVTKGAKVSECDTITNCGEVAAIYTAAISGADAASYSITSPNPSTMVGPGETYVFCVEFTAGNEGATSASLNVTSPDVTTMNIPLTGQSVCAALTHDIPTIIATGATTSSTFTFTITNTGSGSWVPGTPMITGTNAGDYAVVSVVPQPSGNNGDPIPAGGSALVTMTFSPPLGSAGMSRIANVSWPKGVCGDSVSVDLASPAVLSVKETSADGFHLEQTYPNPTQGKVSFTYTTPHEAAIHITLVDMTGKILETLVNGKVSAGEYTVSFDASAYQSGTYIYVLESGSVRLVRQLILAK